jgi:hypothetical protein
VRDDVLDVTVDPGQAAQLNRRLVEGGVEVSELTSSERSLEEIFLSLTGTWDTLS